MTDYRTIERLAKLRADGVLSDEEFETEKAAILASQDIYVDVEVLGKRAAILDFLKTEFYEHPIITSVLVLTISLLAFSFVRGNLFPAPSGPEVEAVLPPGVDVAISAEDLWASFERNEIATIRRFEGQVVLVSGRVTTVDANIFDNPTVRLKSGGWNSVSIKLGSGDIDFAANLQPGDQAHFQCLGVNEVLGTPVFDRCTPSEGPTYIEVGQSE